MTRKTKLPKFPDSYVDERSFEYANSKWMERNQKRTTMACLQYLYDEKLDEIGKPNFLDETSFLILDLGCGTGYSSEILIESGLKVIGIDILPDMLYKAKKKRFANRLNLSLILADIRSLPLRSNSINHLISVSSYNFILHEKEKQKEKEHIVYNTAKSLSQIIKSNGRIVIEFYPNDSNELNLFISSFTNNGFTGFMIKKDIKQRKGQTFLLLKKGDIK